MAKTCYLHLGLRKTASSSFQATCSRNIDVLKKIGITYPLFECVAANEFKIDNHSYPLCSLLSEAPQNLSFNKRWGISNIISEVNQSYEKQFASYLQTENNLLISGEGIARLTEKSLFQLTTRIQAHGYKLKVIALIRHPYTALCSEIQQRIKGGRYFELISLNDCIPASMKFGSFSMVNTYKKLRSFFGDSICFYSFEDACSNPYGPAGFLIQEFLNGNPSSFNFEKRNESLFNLSTRVQNELNRACPSFINGKLNSDYRRFPLEVDKKFDFTGKFLLTTLEYSLAKNFIRHQIAQLNNIAELNYSDNSINFSDPIFKDQ